MDQCCLETMRGTSGSRFPVDKRSEHKASSGMAVVCIPGTTLGKAEAWILPTMANRLLKSSWATRENMPCHSQCCLKGRFLPSWWTTQCLLKVSSSIYICYVDHAMGARTWSSTFGSADLVLTLRGSQGGLFGMSPANWTSLGSSRAALEHSLALVPCLRKPARELQGCSTRSTKAQCIRRVILKAYFGPKSKCDMCISINSK